MIETDSGLAQLIQDLTDRAAGAMSPYRFQHVLGVTHTACALAAAHGLGVERAGLAGLLHDLFKETPPPQIQRELEACGVSIPPEDRDHPKTWHGLRAAVFAEGEMGLSDPEILEAITLHTTGDAQISPLARALFVADFCEPGRRTEQAPEILQAAREDLDEGYRRALVAKTRHILSKKGRALHPRAIRALRAWLGEGAWDRMGEATG